MTDPDVYFDLFETIQTDPRFVERFHEYNNQLQTWERSQYQPSAQLAGILLNIARLSHFNLSLLLPYLFPRYENSALSVQERPFSMAMLNLRPDSVTTIRASRQVGKALEEEEPVLTPSGWVSMKDLRVGDLVYDGRGRTCRVAGVYPQGEKDLYEIRTNRSRSVCCLEHLWRWRERGSSDTRWRTDDLQTLLGVLSSTEVELPSMRYERPDPIIDVRPAGIGKAVCISVDSPDKTFVTRGHLVTHNTTTFAAMVLAYAHLLLGIRQLFIVPHMEHLKTIGRKIREMERACRFQIGTQYKQNEYYKEYPGGSVLELIRVYMDAMGVRGKTTDGILLDEAQNFDDAHWPEVEQTQRSSSFKYTVISGTSLTMDTFLEQNYQLGSRDAWLVPTTHILPSGDRKWLNFADPDDIYSCIKEDGLRCPYTGKRIDPIGGRFVSEDRSRAEAGFRSLHIPQVIVPSMVGNPADWGTFYRQFTLYDRPKFLMENLGIPTENGPRELTEEHLRRICTLGSYASGLKRSKENYYRFLVSGCDWGGSDYNPQTKTKKSYTVHCILGVTRDLKFDLVHLSRYYSMDYEEVSHFIAEDHHRFGAYGIASDFGAGSAYNMLLRKEPKIQANRHLILQYAGPKAAMLAAPEQSMLTNHFLLNRTESITQMILDIKKQNEGPRLRCYDWGESGQYLSDFTALRRVQGESALTGETTFRYMRDPRFPDDSLHATNFARVLALLILGEPLLQDRSIMEEVMSRFAGETHVPGILDVGDPISG
jgi:hypothetical protein